MFAQSSKPQSDDLDSFVEEGTANIFPDTSGDQLDNTEILVLKKDFIFLTHYKNGKILGFKSKINNPADGNIEDINPASYLELIETGKIIMNSRQCEKQITLDQAQKIVRLLEQEELI